ncbi:ribbon-helix-helix domain-containing protein [Polaromonas glacialis]|uniref:ribbon-helix-helix domain-containing protein n=1 Tax=Polaromonas glacialis TaxID=866564 RepID=UPI0004981C57|nr:ribbon-helix-helix domain-containing protein [Polaromonas glacialis]
MSTQNKPTALSAGLIAVKGQAVSAAQSAPLSLPAPAPVMGYLKAMTLKLDGERYRQLKQLGLDRGKTSQELLVEAVDMLLGRSP